MKTKGSYLSGSDPLLKKYRLTYGTFLKTFFFFFLPLSISAQTTTIYKETVGNYLGSIAITSYAGWSTPSAVHSASGIIDVTNSIISSDYANASGGTPIKVSSGSSWTISNINTSTYSNIKLSFGMHKSNKLETGAGLMIEVSSNGVTYTPLTMTLLPTGNGTGNSWFYRRGGVEITGVIPATTNLRIRFRNTGLADYGMDDVELTSTIALPLHLLEFTAQRNDNRTTLSWTTVNEENVDHFEVQRSESGVSFSTIQNIKARNSGREEIYSASDLSAVAGKVYFRLLSVDIDGTTTYSKIVSISQKASTQFFSVSNTTSSKELVLVATNVMAGNYQYSIVNMNGQILQKGQLNITTGANQIGLGSSYHHGVYLIQMSNGNFEQQLKFGLQ